MTDTLVIEHVAWLRRLHATGQLLLCGPCDDGTAIIILRCADRAEAERLAASDPFWPTAAYATRSITGFTPAGPENGFLARKAPPAP
jgi:uncharacterized protein YciI